MEQNNCTWWENTSVRIVLAATVLVAIVCITFYMSSGAVNNRNADGNVSTEDEEERMNVPGADAFSGDVKRRRRVPKKQPVSLLRNQLVRTLDDISVALITKRTMCRFEDVDNLEMHKIPNGSLKLSASEEARGNVVIYIAVGLLLTSLGAAIVEAYKEKMENTRKPKPPLARRCSLADLTVLRHTRRESMRSNSFIEDARTPLKLLGQRPPPLNRRCSFPSAPNISNNSTPTTLSDRPIIHLQKSLSVDRGGDVYSENRHNRTIKLMRRH